MVLGEDGMYDDCKQKMVLGEDGLYDDSVMIIFKVLYFLDSYQFTNLIWSGIFPMILTDFKLTM